VLSGAGPADAVTSEAHAYSRLFRSWGMAGGVHAAAIEPGARKWVEPLRRLEAAREDLLLFHYSAYAPQLEPLLDMPQRKLLVYHNVTPADYLWEHQPHVATLCKLGRDRLPYWVSAMDVNAAVSRYNARELESAGARDVHIVPIMLDLDRYSRERTEPPPNAGPLVLSVGRLVPHKRPDLVLRAFELYRRASAPDARLAMVGEALSPAYEPQLRELAGPGVEITGRIPQGRLNALYRAADAMLLLSEHEGFCVPLLEAFEFGVPVVARPSGGMPEVGADAVLWVEDDDLAVVAELLHAAVSDSDLRAELAQRGRARSGTYSGAAAAKALRAAIDATLE
jgi:glycosyltransferase involved in cell wall biosynthesis